MVVGHKYYFYYRQVSEKVALKARFAFSYADAFAAATAMSKSAVLVTGDPEFKPLKGFLQIDWLPSKKS